MAGSEGAAAPGAVVRHGHGPERQDRPDRCGDAGPPGASDRCAANAARDAAAATIAGAGAATQPSDAATRRRAAPAAAGAGPATGGGESEASAARAAGR